MHLTLFLVTLALYVSVSVRVAWLIEALVFEPIRAHTGYSALLTLGLLALSFGAQVWLTRFEPAQETQETQEAQNKHSNSVKLSVGGALLGLFILLPLGYSWLQFERYEPVITMFPFFHFWGAGLIAIIYAPHHKRVCGVRLTMFTIFVVGLPLGALSCWLPARYFRLHGATTRVIFDVSSDPSSYDHPPELLEPPTPPHPLQERQNQALFDTLLILNSAQLTQLYVRQDDPDGPRYLKSESGDFKEHQELSAKALNEIIEERVHEQYTQALVRYQRDLKAWRKKVQRLKRGGRFLHFEPPPLGDTFP